MALSAFVRRLNLQWGRFVDFVLPAPQLFLPEMALAGGVHPQQTTQTHQETSNTSLFDLSIWHFAVPKSRVCFL